MTTQPLPFDGLTVIITGDVDGFTRDSANAAISRLGGKPVGSVSGKTGLVIVGEGAGVSKMAKARTHRLNVIGPETFINLVRDVDNGTWDGAKVGEPVDVYEARTDPEPEPEPDPADLVPFDERHLVGRASNFTKVTSQTDAGPVSKVIGHYRLHCLKCGHKWVQRLTDDATTCPVGAGTVPTAFTGPWDDLDLLAVAPVPVDHTKPPVPVGADAEARARAAAEAALARLNRATQPQARANEQTQTQTPVSALDPVDEPVAVDDLEDFDEVVEVDDFDDVPVDPYDSLDPWDEPSPAPAPVSAPAHPGGDW